MSTFRLNQQLANDCLQLGRFGNSELLLFNNALLPWFILVPHTTACEIFDLESTAQAALYAEISDLGLFVRQTFKTDKINTAAIGNKVRQLHIHVVGRFENDFCWPNVVWGTSQSQPYTAAQHQQIINWLCDYCGNRFCTAAAH